MRRITALLLAVVMVFGLATTALAATVNQSVSSETIKAGEDVTVTLTLDEPMDNIIMYQYKLYFDDSLFTLKSSTGSANVSDKLTNTSGTYYMISYVDPTSSGQTIAAGTLAALTFTALSDLSEEKIATFNFVKDYVWDNSYTFKDIDDGSVTNDNVSVTIKTDSGEVPQFTGYAVTASADQTITAGEKAEVKITVSNSEETVTTYNAYDLAMTYDTSKLTYVSCVAADENASVTVVDDIIRVKGYGADKNVGTAAVTLNFTAKATGEAEVKINSAYVDINSQAIENDAPPATILDDTTVITVSGYPVTLGEGLSGASVAAPNEDYTFSATDADHYNYTVTATMGGEDVTVKDNDDGTYTISNVTGALVINAKMTPKSYSVSVDGTGKGDVTAADTATYNTAYSFTVTEDSGYTYKVSVTIGGSAYTLGTPENGTYTIGGTAITGDIVITVTKEPKPVTTVSVTKPDWVTGGGTAVKDQDYTFSITKEEGYKYGEPTVMVGGTDITKNLVKNEDGSYTIPGAYVTGDITIEVSRDFDITVDVTEYITLDEQAMYLITVSGNIDDDSVAMYDGNSMFWSDEYDAYAYLVISADNLETVKAEAAQKVTVAEGTAAGTVDYTGDVNGTEVIDVNDAQLTYDMYNAKYDSFETVSMLKFLNADVNASKTVNVEDATAIIAAIQ